MTPAERAAKWNREHPEKRKQINAAYRAAHPGVVSAWCRKNPDRRKQHRKAWADKHPDYFAKHYIKHQAAIRARSAQWKKDNAGRVNATCMRRYTQQRRATPPWLTTAQYQQIEAIYIEAKRRENEDGIKHHVDHIYPLKGKTCCGLHVPWNLQILVAVVNIKKSNKLETA